MIGRAFAAFVATLTLVGLVFPPQAVPREPQPGTTITKSNMDEYREFFFPTLDYFVRKAGMEIPVAEYRRYDWPPKYKEATEKYSGQVKLSPDGRDMQNYVAGAPFPNIDPNDPLAAYKWMWNHEQKTPYTDNIGCGWNTEIVNSKGERERFFGSNFWRRLMFRGRMYIDPQPVIPHEPALIYAEQWGPLHDPNDLKGAGVLNFRYVSPNVPDDTYMYLPDLRKVRRLAVSNRSDAFWGTDIDIDSIWVWNSKLSFWTFKLLADKKTLQAVHAGGYGQREAWCAQPDGQSGMRSFIYCVPHELRDTVIIEGTPTGFSQYAYSKRILYIDKEILMAWYNEGYDQGGELWKTWYWMGDVGKEPHGLQHEGNAWKIVPTRTSNPPKSDYEKVFGGHGGMVDVQLDHTSKWDCPDAYLYPNLGVKHAYANEVKDWNTPDTFTINYLIRSAGF
jgi:hypothetical protein